MAPADVRLCVRMYRLDSAGLDSGRHRRSQNVGRRQHRQSPPAGPAIGYCIHSLSTSLAKQIIGRVA